MDGSPTPSVLCALAFYFVSLLGLVQIVQAQNGTTPPSEVSALNSVFNQWGISARTATDYQWNISGEPCSGAAINTSVPLLNYNPGIKCDCNGTVCHITQLKVYALDLTGGIPEELRSLTSLTYLNLGYNALSGEVPKELGKLTNLTVLSISENNFSGSLPSELGNLENLEELHLADNALSGEVPKELGKTN